MANLKKIKDDLDPIIFDMSTYLESIDKDSSEITGVIFMLKALITDADTAAKYSKVLADEQITKRDNKSTISVVVNDYESLAVDSEYFICLGVKFSGDTKYREVQLDQDKVTIEQDRILD